MALVTAPPTDDVLYGLALADLREDADELLVVARSGVRRLAGVVEALESSRADLWAATREELVGHARRLAARYRAVSTRLLALRETADGARADRLGEVAAERAAIADLLRSLQQLSAAVATAADWQSPSYLHSLRPAAGLQVGSIVAHTNDYKRDRHLDATAYERAYAAQLPVEAGAARAFLTSCGMAALTTVLSVLRSEGALARVVAGRALYHESLELLRREPVGSLQLVDEADTCALVEAIDRCEPTAVFLDLLCNTRLAPLPDLAAICAALRSCRPEVALVVDATALAAPGAVFRLVEDDPAIRPMCFESLLKYAQLGFDRVNAGVLVVRERDAERFSHAREHLGTNVADTSVHALPLPDRRVLERRLRRLQRNAGIVAARLEQELGSGSWSPIEAISYPGLASHPACERARQLPFHGACVGVAFETDVAVRWQERLVRRAIALARRARLPLLAGSSFGFDVTRVYTTAAETTFGEPFVRVAAGTEHLLAVEQVAEILARALRDVCAAYGCSR